MPIDIVDKLLASPSDKCIAGLQKGLDALGLYKVMQTVPQLLYLLRPNKSNVTAKMLLNLLAPQLSTEGSASFS